MKKVFLLVGLLIMIAACSTPAPEPVNEPVTNEVPVPGSDVPEAVVAGEEHIVEIKGFKFVPAELTVKAGDTVTWINAESTAHTVTASAGDFESDRLEKGDRFSFTFEEAGDFAYLCGIHRGMRATVTVE